MSPLKKIRVIVSVVFFIALGIFFLGSSLIPSDAGNILTVFQLIPAISKSLTIAFWPSIIGAVLLIALTFVFGRVYCSFLCPLGTAQDIVHRISRRRKKYKHFGALPPFQWIAYALLAAAVCGMIFGVSLLTGLFDPFSIAGRIAADLIKPGLSLLWNLVNDGLNALGVYTFSYEELPVISLAAALIAAFFLIGTTVLSWTRGRLYCNTVCPVGALLGLISRASVFRITIDPESCIKCGKCAKVCKAGCIDYQDKSIDFSRCVGCMNCIPECPEKSIAYRPARKSAVKEFSPERRELIKDSLKYGIGLGVSLLLPAALFGKEIFPSNKPITPPGSQGVDRFMSWCTGCHICVSHCPTRVLKPSFLEYGLTGMLIPRMDYPNAFCEYNCKKCTEVCPTGALKPVSIAAKQTIQIGKVSLEKTRCVVYRKELACGACAEICPTHAVYLVEYKPGLNGPETDNSICVGCGACQFACPVQPVKAIFVEGLEQHLTAKKPKVSQEGPKSAEDEEFPF